MSAGALGGVHDETSFCHKLRSVRILCSCLPVPADRESRFTFHDGRTTTELVYTLSEPPPIPTMSPWGMVALVLLVFVAGTIALGARTPILHLFCLQSQRRARIAAAARIEGRLCDVATAITEFGSPSV